MIRDEFEILAAKVLADEAAPEEIARLRSILVENPELEAEFAELRATWSALQEAAPAAEAMDAPPANPPANRVKKWEATLSAKYGLPETDPLRSAQTVPDSSSFASRVVRYFAFSPWQAAIAASAANSSSQVSGDTFSHTRLAWTNPHNAAMARDMEMAMKLRRALEMSDASEMMGDTDIPLDPGLSDVAYQPHGQNHDVEALKGLLDAAVQQRGGWKRGRQ